MAARKKRNGVQWVGGFGAMPAYVTGEGEPYRPEALVWLNAQGAVLGSTVAKPGELLDQACESLQGTIERPLFGHAHAPTKVRVASPQLAATLRAGHPTIDFVGVPTPEIDALFATMREKMGEDAELEQSYLAPDIDPDAVAALFRAAARLFRAQPWLTVPSDQSLFSVTIEKLGVRDAVLSVIGQLGQSLGLIMFSSIDDFEAYVGAAEAREQGVKASIPPYFALNFERGAELSAELRKEIAVHCWEVAGAEAYPWLVAVDDDLVARPPTGREVTIAEAVALAVSEVLTQKPALLAAWSGGETLSISLSVPTHVGDVEVGLRIPCELDSDDYAPPYDLLAGLLELEDEDELDRETRAPLEDELVRCFLASPEANGLTDVQSCNFVMDFAAEYFGVTIASLGPKELEEIVFDIVPRKVSIEASAAGEIIGEIGALYAFLARELELKQAPACQRVLGGDAVKRLEAALADTRNFGMAKSLVMAGHAAGFAVDTPEGLAAWMNTVQSRPLPASVNLPSLGALARPVDKAAARAKKKQRKAVRKARKKNR